MELRVSLSTFLSYSYQLLRAWSPEDTGSSAAGERRVIGGRQPPAGPEGVGHELQGHGHHEEEFAHRQPPKQQNGLKKTSITAHPSQAGYREGKERKLLTFSSKTAGGSSRMVHSAPLDIQRKNLQ
jgi:hypothetical protein